MPKPNLNTEMENVWRLVGKGSPAKMGREAVRLVSEVENILYICLEVTRTSFHAFIPKCPFPL